MSAAPDDGLVPQRTIILNPNHPKLRQEEDPRLLLKLALGSALLPLRFPTEAVDPEDVPLNSDEIQVLIERRPGKQDNIEDELIVNFVDTGVLDPRYSKRMQQILVEEIEKSDLALSALADMTSPETNIKSVRVFIPLKPSKNEPNTLKVQGGKIEVLLR
jgi:hypothetical protein